METTTMILKIEKYKELRARGWTARQAKSYIDNPPIVDWTGLTWVHTPRISYAIQGMKNLVGVIQLSNTGYQEYKPVLNRNFYHWSYRVGRTQFHEQANKFLHGEKKLAEDLRKRRVHWMDISLSLYQRLEDGGKFIGTGTESHYLSSTPTDTLEAVITMLYTRITGG